MTEDTRQNLILLFVSLYYFWLGIDIISNEVAKHKFNQGLRDGKFRPTLLSLKLVDPFSEVEEIKESKETIQ